MKLRWLGVILMSTTVLAKAPPSYVTLEMDSANCPAPAANVQLEVCDPGQSCATTKEAVIGDGVTLTWTAPAGTFDGYRVRWSQTAAGSWDEWFTMPPTTKCFSFPVQRAMRLKLSAYNQHGESPGSNEILIKLKP